MIYAGNSLMTMQTGRDIFPGEINQIRGMGTAGIKRHYRKGAYEERHENNSCDG